MSGFATNPVPPPNPGPGGTPGQDPVRLSTERKIMQVKRRLVREATMAISMLEAALDALWTLDRDAAKAVRMSDDRIDMEEVEIEQQCYEILTLHHPFARDFRVLTFVLKVNSDLERVADHACSVAKSIIKIADALGDRPTPAWPTALVELGQRVPGMCHELMRAVLDEDVDAARRLVAADKVIDQLDRRLFEEAMVMMRPLPGSATHSGDGPDPDLAIGMLVYRIGRELERVGDLMGAIAEDVVYLATGSIIRHEKRRTRLGA